MLLLLKIIEVLPQRSFQSPTQGTVAVAPLLLQSGRHTFYAEAYGADATSLPQNLGGGEMIWGELAFSATPREYEGKKFYDQRVRISSVERFSI